MKKYAKCGTGTVNYLSSTICDEFIDIISTNIRSMIINDIKEAKYYALIIDSTPDVSHVDQLTVVIRYVLPNDIQEIFLAFLPITSHTGEYHEEAVVAYLKDINIDIMNYRS